MCNFTYPIQFQIILKDLKNKIVRDKVIEHNGLNLKYVPSHLLTISLCEKSVEQNGNALEFEPNHLQTISVIEKAVEQNGVALQYISDNKSNFSINLKAVKKNCHALKYVNVMRFEEYQELRKHAVGKYGIHEDFINIENDLKLINDNTTFFGLKTKFTLEYLPDKLKTEKVLIEMVKYNGLILKNIPDKLKTTLICESAIQENFLAIQNVPNNLLNIELCKLSMEGFIKMSKLIYKNEWCCLDNFIPYNFLKNLPLTIFENLIFDFVKKFISTCCDSIDNLECLLNYVIPISVRINYRSENIYIEIVKNANGLHKNQMEFFKQIIENTKNINIFKAMITKYYESFKLIPKKYYNE